MSEPTPTPATEFRLPNGVVLDLSDWVDHSLRSAFIVDPNGSDVRWDLFTYGRTAPVPGGGDLQAQRVHTNVPRSGENGLPRAWEMHVMNWRAQTNQQLEQPVMDWAAETVVQFEYNDKHYANTTLLDLLMHAQPMGQTRPPHMRENLGYVVRVESDPVALRALREWLRNDVVMTARVREAVNELDTIIRMRSSDEALVESLQHARSKLVPSRSLTMWVHLEGLMKRVIV